MCRNAIARARRLASCALLALTLLVLVAGCQSEVRRIRFKTVAQGQGYHNHDVVSLEERTRVLLATNNDELQILYEGATGRPYDTADEAWKRVDMAREIVMAIVMYAPLPYAGPGESPIEVVGVIAVEDSVHIFVRIHRNPPGIVIEQLATRPYQVVALSRDGMAQVGDVRFIVDTTEGDRFAETTYCLPSER